MKTNRNEVGQYKRGKSRKGGLIFIGLICIFILCIIASDQIKKASITSYTAITATSTENVTDTSDADIAKQTAVFQQGLVLNKEKRVLDEDYKRQSDVLEKKLEDNRKDQMSFTAAPLSK